MRTYYIQMNGALKFDAPKHAAFARFIVLHFIYYESIQTRFYQSIFVRYIPTCIRKHLRNIIFAFALPHLPNIVMYVSR